MDDLWFTEDDGLRPDWNGKTGQGFRQEKCGGPTEAGFDYDCKFNGLDRSSMRGGSSLWSIRAFTIRTSLGLPMPSPFNDDEEDDPPTVDPGFVRIKKQYSRSSSASWLTPVVLACFTSQQY